MPADMLTKAINALGYFDKPSDVPAFDPAVCAICEGGLIGHERQSRGLMLIDGAKSYFFGWHLSCRDEVLLEKIEHDLVAEIEDMEITDHAR